MPVTFEAGQTYQVEMTFYSRILDVGRVWKVFDSLGVLLADNTDKHGWEVLSGAILGGIGGNPNPITLTIPLGTESSNLYAVTLFVPAGLNVDEWYIYFYVSPPGDLVSTGGGWVDGTQTCTDWTADAPTCSGSWVTDNPCG
jgi:hypothetical protein